MFDLGPAAAQLSRLVSGVRDDQLARPTPCTDWKVADLLAHIHQFSSVFTDNARRQPMNPPQQLVDDWRVAIPAQLEELTTAWRDEAAWQGRVSAGGVEMEARDNAVVGVEELTVHGWDLARATDQPIEITDEQLDRIDDFLTLFAPADTPGQGPFGPHAPLGQDTDRLSRTLAQTGREPGWSRPA